jgi:hypothetical protein
VEDVGIQKLEDGDPHLLMASVAESGNEPEPTFIFQLFPGKLLDDIQQGLGYQTFEFAEGLPLENGAYPILFGRVAFAQDQLPNFLEQGRGRVGEFLFQFLQALQVGELRKLAVREFQELFHFFVNACAVSGWRCFFPG